MKRNQGQALDPAKKVIFHPPKRRIAAAWVLCLASLAHTSRGAADSTGRVGWIPLSFLTRPIALRKGIGNLREPLSTGSRPAQDFYDQGLAYLQSYVWLEAARSFHQALRSDPKLAMAYLGLSYAYSPMDYAAAETALKQAEMLAAGAPDRERRRIQIRELQMRAMLEPGRIELTLAYRDAIDDALGAYPNDIVFLLLRGVAQQSSPFADGQGCDMGGAPYFEQVLTLDPQNFAAHHFLTHCDENSGRIQEALPHAKMYAELAAEVPHAQHMYGHVLRRAGEMDQAILQLRKADQLHHDYFARENIPAWYDWHYAHNLQLLASSYQYVGQIKKAEQNFQALAALPAFTDYDSFTRKVWPEFLLQQGRYAQALAAAQALSERPALLARTMGHALAGDAYLATNRSADAANELKNAEDMERELRAVDVVSVRAYVDGLRAALLLKQGERAAAKELFPGVIGRIRATNGPDAWTQGLFHLEFLCRVIRDQGEWDLAAEVAQAMYERAPDYAGSHYALALVAHRQGDGETADREFLAAERLWRKADSDLPELAETRRALGETKRGVSIH